MMNDEDYYFGDYMAVGMNTEESWPCPSASVGRSCRSFEILWCCGVLEDG
jgi:hypothetical protein